MSCNVQLETIELIQICLIYIPEPEDQFKCLWFQGINTLIQSMPTRNHILLRTKDHIYIFIMILAKSTFMKMKLPHV